ncbi:MAG: leucine--tRNA ligase [Aigarchaeota archaeon]|nr:leucine--tRNA ligase [Candidatus Pelearchaeum maunauluense]
MSKNITKASMEEWVSKGFELGSKQRLSSPREIEVKWLNKWKAAAIFQAEPQKDKPKFFICVPYSYQNGPLHLGHGFTFTRGDVIARFKRMQGYNVLFPWSWHWTGEAVAGTSERLKRGDESVIKMLKEIDGVPEELIPFFQEPAFICSYYTAENRQVVDLMGWSVDWRREFYTTDLHPYYSRFITWQYEVLRRNGYVIKGKHPVVWCPSCQSATGDHDRLSGEGVFPEEFTLVFFDAGDFRLAAATLRPETIFGATNVWINPEAKYVVVRWDGKKVLISDKAYEKLREQKGEISPVEELEGRKLIGAKCRVPLTGAEILILPASFVDPAIGSGVVYSVPAHAPYDYAALRDLWRAPEGLAPYGIDAKAIRAIKPIAIIETPGFGELPAVEVVEKLGIIDQRDEKLGEATKEVYSREFHSGVLKENCGDYKGMRVSEAREAVRQKLINMGEGDTMYDLPEKVVCRSGDECIVKIVEDQWFLNYSRGDWKERVRKIIKEMNIYPEEARQWFLNVVDWLRDWACTRKTGLGTPLPWDRSWIVETLSDSTIYPALYTISKYLNNDPVLQSKVSTEILDYVFLGRGSAEELARKSGIDAGVLRAMRDEFLYWYPVDMRISAKELVPNHLTFYLFHHSAIFDEERWPRGIGVNGMISIEGMKMSKSKGNIIPLKVAVARHGADVTRCTLLLGAEDLDDPDWWEKNAIEIGKDLHNILSLMRESANAPREALDADSWLLSRLQLRIARITRALEKLKTRTACNEVIYGMLNDFRWYMRRNGGRLGSAARVYAETWARLLAPFAPYTAEEGWSILGGEGYVSLAEWPKYRPENIDIQKLLKEEIIRDLRDDIYEIIKVTEKKPSKITLYVAAEWKNRLAALVIDGDGINQRNRGQIIKKAVVEIPERKGEIPTLVPKLADVLRRVQEYSNQICKEIEVESDSKYISALLREERSICMDVAVLLENELGAKTIVIPEEEAREDPMGKARNALPFRPGIYVE